MILLDVNILLYAHRRDLPQHAAIHRWLEHAADSGQQYGVADIALSGFLRIVTHPRIFKQPTPITDALSYVAVLLDQEHCQFVRPGARHWQIFTGLCRRYNAQADTIPDLYYAAVAIEIDAELITVDKGFRRYSELRSRNPLI